MAAGPTPWPPHATNPAPSTNGAGNVSAASTAIPSIQRAMTDEEKQAMSWQYYGYPALSEWMAASKDCFVIRRYSKESARCLLRLQNEIAKISKQIDEIDKASQNLPVGCGTCDTFDEDEFPERPELIKQMEFELQSYYDLVNAFSLVRKNPTARTHHLRNLDTWFTNHPGAIHPREQHFLDNDKRRDLFPIVFKERSPLRLLLGRWRWLRYQFTPFNTAGHVEPATGTYTSDTALDVFTNVIILCACLCLLFGPMWTLHFVQTDTTRLAIITGFVIAFTSLTFLAAGQRPFEVLAATAAYAAVLMVYLQNNDS